MPIGSGADARRPVPVALAARFVALVLLVGVAIVPVMSAAVAATTAAPLSGRVSVAGAAVPNASVTVHDLERDALVATTATDGDGSYAIAELDAGDYAVVAPPPAAAARPLPAVRRRGAVHPLTVS